MRSKAKKHPVGKKYYYKIAFLIVILLVIFFFSYRSDNGTNLREDEEPLEFTPLEDFFAVQIGDVPQIALEEWSLEITGLVENPLVLTYDDILAMESVTEKEVLMCVQSPRRLFAIGNWTGIKLKSLLEQVGVTPGAKEVVFYAVDDFSSSLELGDVTDDVLLAYKVNDMVLTPNAGYPLRLVVPNKWGYKWVKWIKKIELVDYDYEGFWESRGWDDKAEVPEKYKR